MEQKILMLDTMLEQAREYPDVFNRIAHAINRLREYAVSLNSIYSFLKKHNGKKVKNADKVWKYRLSRGERILYTYGRNVNGIRKEDEGAIVLLAYSNHDRQISIAQSIDLEVGHSTERIDLNEEDPSLELTDDEKTIISEIDLPYEQQTTHHRLLVAPDDEFKAIDESELDVYLSEEQYKCISSFREEPKPTLVLGGAGTGKSMIALHILADYSEKIKSANTGIRIAYFTQSTELRRNSEHRFHNIIPHTGESTYTQIMFQDIDTFCFDFLKYKAERRKKYVDQFRFINEFPSYFKKYADSRIIGQAEGIDWIQVWTEIRGVIKGQLNKEWRRFTEKNQREIGNCVSYLEKEGWIRRSSENKQFILLNNSVEELNERMRNAPPKHGQSEMLKLLEYFSSVDYSMHDMGEAAYLNLSDEESTVPYENGQRRLIWNIYRYYELFLKENGYFDGNDLVLETLAKGSLPSFDMVVVDEVQDCTELQIYLANELSNKTSILYVGDGNQNVNPTLFRADHLRQLYRNKGKELNEITLTKNYRSPDLIIKITNALAKLRSQTIAMQHLEQEMEETAIRRGTQPYRLKWSNENIQNTLLQLSNYPFTALLVPDNETKEKMLKIAKELPGLGDTPFIFTVSEIKGMEYKYVVCYNLISRYHRIWEKIFTREKKSYRTGERFYFNLLYVAMTRSQKHLGFIDEEYNPELEDILNLERIETWNVDALHYVEMDKTSAGWFLQAQQNEKEGKYEDAILFYQRANAEEKYITRCRAKQLVAKFDYDMAFKYALLSGDKETIQETALHCSKMNMDTAPLTLKQSQLFRVSQLFAYSGANENKMGKEQAADSIVQLIDSIFLDDSERQLVYNLAQSQIEEMLSEKIDSIETWLLERI